MRYIEYIMADPTKKTAYQSGRADDTARRTWDRDAYAAKAVAREAAEREESKARHEAKLAGKKYHAPGPDPADQQLTDARNARLDVASHVGKVQIISGAQAAVGKRGKGAGFYCEACDLTFKDNLQWVEHLNSHQHQVATGTSGEVKRATVEEVRERLAWLKRRIDEEARQGEEDLGERLKLRGEQEEREREERRAKRREKRRKNEPEEDETAIKHEGDDEMASMMGFGGFGTTKT